MLLKTLLTVILFLISLTAMTSAQDAEVQDTLIIEQVTIGKGDKAVVKVSFFNDEKLAALTIPLKVTGKGYKIDSVSFAGSRIDYLKMKPVTVQKDSQSVVFGAIVMMEDYIQPGRGLMASLHLSPKDNNYEGECFIDTTTIPPANLLYTIPSSESFTPVVSRGALQVSDSAKTR